MVVLCLIFLSGETLVVYATEDGLTNEVNEANENRFSEKSPWLDHADESIYSDDIDAGETPQQIEPKDPGLVEKYASELIRNATSSLISLLEGKMGAGIDRIIYGRVGSGKPNSVNIYAFELRSGNPYGVTASVCYALLRSIIFVLLGIYFVFILAKSAWTGHTAQNREQIKSNLYLIAVKFIYLALMPYLFDVVLYVRDVVLHGLKSVTGMMLADGAKLSLSNAFLLNAEFTGRFIDAMMYLGTVGLTLYFAVIYIAIAIDMLVCFIAFPILCLMQSPKRNLMDSWVMTVLSNVLTPVLDAVLLLIPLLTSMMLADVIEGIAFIQLIMCMLIIPARNRIKALLGVQSNERGGFFSAMALLALGRTIAGKTKGAIKRGADIRSDLEKSRAHKEMADADEEESDAILGGFGQNSTQSRAGQGSLEELSSRDENSLGELDTSAIDAGGPEERSVEDYDAGYSEDPFYSAYDTDLERHESMPVQAEDFGESEIIGESEGEFHEGIPERAGTAGEGIEENRTSNESIKAGALEGKPEEMETQEGNVPEDLKETEVSGGVNGEVLSRNQILRDLDKSMEQKQRTIDALKVQKAGFQTEQKRVESQMLNHDRGSEEYRQLEKQRAQMALRASETEQKIAGQMQNLNQLRNEAKAVKGSMAGATPTLFDDKKAEILCKRANINNFDQPEFRNALSNAQMAKLYQKRAAQNLAKGAAATVGTFAGGAMLGGAAMFMQPGTAMMGVTAGASAGAVVGSGIISAGVAASGTAKWAGNKVRFIKEVEQSKIGTGVDFADAYAQAPVYSGAAQTMGQPIMENQPKQRTVSPVSVKTRSSQVEDVIVVPKQTATLSEVGVENIQQVENTVQKIQEEIEQDSIRALQKVFSPAGMFKNSVALTALERANVEAEKYFATLRETGAPELTRKQEIEKRVDFQTRCITEEVLDSLSISPDYEKGTENYRKAEEIIHTKVRMIVEKRNKDLF